MENNTTSKYQEFYTKFLGFLALGNTLIKKLEKSDKKGFAPFAIMYAKMLDECSAELVEYDKLLNEKSPETLSDQITAIQIVAFFEELKEQATKFQDKVDEFLKKENK